MHNRSCLFLSCIALIGWHGPLQAQQLPAAQIAQIETEMPTDASDASKPALHQYVVDRTRLMVDIVWSTEKLTIAKPSVETQMLYARIPPYINGSVITYPVLYAALMDNVGLTIGHDVYAQDDTIPVAKPVLQKPFAEPDLFMSMDPGILYFQDTWYQANKDLIICQVTVTGCRNMQGMVRYALSLFLVAHECGHYVHGDAHEGIDEQHEENADAFAWDVMQKIAAAYHTDDADVNAKFDEMFGAGAFAFLAFEREGNINRVISQGGDPDQDSAVLVLQHRFDALQTLAGDLGDTIAELMPDDPTGTTYRTVSLQWTTAPDVLIVNGTLLSVGNETGKTLLVRDTGKTRVLAWSAAGIALVAIDPSANLPINLDYRPYISGASQADIEAAQTAKDWSKVLQMGTKDGGVRVGGWAAHAVNLALSRNQATVAVDRTPTGDASVDRDANFSATRSEALWNWGIN